jgi:hypothetical protein
MKKITRLMFSGILILLLVFLAASCKKNSPPVVNSVTVNPTAVDPGQTATVTVTATDPDGDLLTYAYVVNGGAINGTGPTVQWIAPSLKGAYSVSVTVTDEEGMTAMGSGALTVNEIILFTGISGTAKFKAGVSGDLANSKVSLYTTLENWNNNSPIKYGAVTGSGAQVTFKLAANPGNYYLDIWKDIDNNGFWSVGDFIGWYGSGGLGSPDLTEIQLMQDQNFAIEVTMYVY